MMSSSQRNSQITTRSDIPIIDFSLALLFSWIKNDLKKYLKKLA